MNECAKSTAAPVAKRSIPWMFDLNGVKLETDLTFYHFSEAWGERCRHEARYLTLMAGRAGSPRHKLCVKYFIFRDTECVVSWDDGAGLVLPSLLSWHVPVTQSWGMQIYLQYILRLDINRELRDPVPWSVNIVPKIADIWRVQENIWMLCNNRIKIFANRSLNDILADRSDWLLLQGLSNDVAGISIIIRCEF